MGDEAFPLTSAGYLQAYVSVWCCHKDQEEGQASMYYMYLFGVLLELEPRITSAAVSIRVP